MPWTRWQGIELSCAHKRPAVYQIRMVSRIGHPCCIPRFLRPDDSGILSIGHSGNLENRRRQFVRAMKCGGGHSSGNLFYCLCSISPLRQVFADHKIQLRYKTFDDKGTAIAEEATMLKDYVRRFGEAPPLCSIIPDLRSYLVRS